MEVQLNTDTVIPRPDLRAFGAAAVLCGMLLCRLTWGRDIGSGGPRACVNVQGGPGSESGRMRKRRLALGITRENRMFECKLDGGRTHHWTGRSTDERTLREKEAHTLSLIHFETAKQLRLAHEIEIKDRTNHIMLFQNQYSVGNILIFEQGLPGRYMIYEEMILYTFNR